MDLMEFTKYYTKQVTVYLSCLLPLQSNKIKKGHEYDFLHQQL